jgi:WS/DGAT C-terminal domain
VRPVGPQVPADGDRSPRRTKAGRRGPAPQHQASAGKGESCERACPAVTGRRRCSGPPPPLGLYHWFINHQRLWHTLVSNLRGPDQPVSLAGATISAVIPWPSATPATSPSTSWSCPTPARSPSPPWPTPTTSRTCPPSPAACRRTGRHDLLARDRPVVDVSGHRPARPDGRAPVCKQRWEHYCGRCSRQGGPQGRR